MSKWLVAPLLLLLPIWAWAQDAPIPPALAPAHMTVPAGFHVSLFAGEPDVVQPIAFTIDDRGRLWVAENFSYPHWQTDGKPGHDRILIFDDPDGTGHFKTRKVFADNLSNVSGLEVGFGGVWVCSTPNLIYIPLGADDKPAGPAQVLLDGWSLEAKHNVFNRLTWGPDGWLYGCNGILATSHVGKPGTPDDQRIPFNCGVWRYHPTRHVFEPYAWGTTNPWGLDFDDDGQMFITNCVIKHLWHVIPGAHYQRMYGADLNPNVYGLMESCADHVHFVGDWTDARKGMGRNSEYGGGHAHAGAMVYLGDNWPDSYRNSIFMVNIHGARVNHDILEHKGSGYVGHHGSDFLLANDPWFRGLNLAYGPDGGVFLSDWTDTGECHNYDRIDQTNGRIYKVVYGRTKPVTVDVAHASDADLVAMQLHHNDWFDRHARRVLQERAAAGKLDAGTVPALMKILDENPDPTRKLRAMWALYSVGSLDDGKFLSLLDSPHEYVRAWAIQLSYETGNPSGAILEKFAQLAASDPSPAVRLHLASALQRLPIAQRWDIAAALASHGEDATDQNIPLMLWYGIEPLAAADHDRAAGLLVRCKIPIVRQYIARRIAQ
jgi:putative membrane-bound dehydrogenase-like protein